MVQNPATTSDQVGRDFHFRRAWIRERQKASPSLLRVMTIQGDSMIPRLQDGNVVLVDMTQRSPNPPRFFVLYDGMGLVAKRLEFIPMSEPPKGYASLQTISSTAPMMAPPTRSTVLGVSGGMGGRCERRVFA